VVLVHGSVGGLDSWDPITPLLVDGFELWVYARRGYAPSDGCRRPKTYADDVRDLQAVLTAAGGSAHVVGASYGATVALHTAYASSTAIRSAALFEPPLFAAGAETATALDRFRELVDAGDTPAGMRLFAEKVSRVPAAIIAALADTGPGPPGEGHKAVAAAEARGCLHDLEAMTADTPDVHRWTQIDVPILLMQGSDTWPPMPATMDVLAGALPNAARVVLPGQSHFATHTAPEMFAHTLRTFLHDQEQQRRSSLPPRHHPRTAM
jgi:pimeloyl-ACP methyl ester carboxylesterase